jgi:hypothetical protein
MYFLRIRCFVWKETTSTVFKCVLLFWISFNTIRRLEVGPLSKRDNNSVNSEVIVVNLYKLLVLLYRNNVFVIKLSYLLLCLVLQMKNRVGTIGSRTCSRKCNACMLTTQVLFSPTTFELHSFRPTLKCTTYTVQL